MPSKSVSIPFGMVTRKFYCHQCGQILHRYPRSRTVRPGDPDYRKYAFRRIGGKLTFWFGDVEITEYEFRCYACDIFTKYDKQLVIEHIQKNSGKHRLMQSEIRAQESHAKVVVNRKKTLWRLFIWLISLALIAIYLSA